MLLIPAVLLPITIVFIALSRFQTTAKVSDSHMFSTYRMQDQDEQKIEEDIFWRKYHVSERAMIRNALIKSSP